MSIRVGVFGAAGRMGATVCDAVVADPELELVAAVDPAAAGSMVAGTTVSTEAAAIAAAGASVAVDFTHLDGARANAGWCAANGIHHVIGTSGLTSADLDTLRTQFTASNCLVAPNFAIGAVLMMRFAELAAPFFDTAEIIELHHDAKIDAPSATARATAERMGRASSEWAGDPTTNLAIAGARGAEGPSGIRVHSVRMRGMVASQEVVLGTTGQTLTIRHDTTDRSSFMPGVVLACKRIADHPGVTLGLDRYLGL